MLAEAVLVWREDTASAKRTLQCSWWMRPYTLVAIKVTLEENWATFITLFVLVAVLALLDQVFIEGTNLNDLLAFPACRQHRARLPIVDIDWLFIKILVVCSTEVAAFLVNFVTVIWLCSVARRWTLTVLRVWIHLLLGTHFVRWVASIARSTCLVTSTSRWTTFLVEIFDGTFRSLWIDICRYNFLTMLRCRLRRVATVCFCQQSLYLLDLSLAKSTECASYIIAQIPVQLDYAALSWLSDVLKSVNKTLTREI